MSVEQPTQMGLVGVCEMIRPAQQSESCSEQVRFLCWGTLLGGTALQFSSYQGEALGEPADDMKAVQYMARIWQVLRDGSLI